jgi:hypothetical protein
VTAFGLGDVTLASPLHCGQQFKYKSTTYGWDGNFEISRAFFACPECGIQLCVEVKQDVGPVPA